MTKSTLAAHTLRRVDYKELQNRRPFLSTSARARLIASLLTFISPFKIVANSATGLLDLNRAILRRFLRLIGWLSGAWKPVAALSRISGIVIKRWHVAVGTVIVYGGLRSIFRLSRHQHTAETLHILDKMARSQTYEEWHALALSLQRGMSAQAPSAASSENGTSGTTRSSVSQSHRRLPEDTFSEGEDMEDSLKFDRLLLQEKVAHLRHVKACGTVADAMFAVRADLVRNLGGIATLSKQQTSFLGGTDPRKNAAGIMPLLIQEYIREVCGHVQDITHSPHLPLDSKEAFLKETRQSFGRTALVLSGGGALGAFHLGVVKALLQHGLLPRVLAGNSTGALVAALAATKTDLELEEFFNSQNAKESPLPTTTTTTPHKRRKEDSMGHSPPSSPLSSKEKKKKKKHLLLPLLLASTSVSSIAARGLERFVRCSSVDSRLIGRLPRNMLRLQDMETALQDLLGKETTFYDAYQRTGRILNISLVPCRHRRRKRAHDGKGDLPPTQLMLNYLTAPHVVLWSAVLCSMSSVLADPAPPLLALVDEQRLSAPVPPPPPPILPEVSEDGSHAFFRLENTAQGRLTRHLLHEGGWRDGALFEGTSSFSVGGTIRESVHVPGLPELFSVNHTIVSQTSPLLVPLLGLRRVTGRLGKVVEGEWRHRCRQLSETCVFLPWASAAFRMFSRPWEGDITMIPPPLGSLSSVVVPHDASDHILFHKKRSEDEEENEKEMDEKRYLAEMLEIQRMGEYATWERLSAIQSNCGIEVTLDACIQSVATWRRAEKMGREDGGHHAGGGIMLGGTKKEERVMKRMLSMPCLSSAAFLDDDGVYDGTENDLTVGSEFPMGSIPLYSSTTTKTTAAAAHGSEPGDTLSSLRQRTGRRPPTQQRDAPAIDCTDESVAKAIWPDSTSRARRLKNKERKENNSFEKGVSEDECLLRF